MVDQSKPKQGRDWSTSTIVLRIHKQSSFLTFSRKFELVNNLTLRLCSKFTNIGNNFLNGRVRFHHCQTLALLRYSDFQQAKLRKPIAKLRINRWLEFPSATSTCFPACCLQNNLVVMHWLHRSNKLTCYLFLNVPICSVELCKKMCRSFLQLCTAVCSNSWQLFSFFRWTVRQLSLPDFNQSQGSMPGRNGPTPEPGTG